MSEQLDSGTAMDEPTVDPVAFVRGLEELPVALIVCRGPEHVVIGANRSARAFFGHRPGIVGRPIQEVFPGSAGQQIFPIQHHVYLTGEPFTAVEWRVVVDGQADGDERFMTFRLVALRGVDGAPSGVACEFFDVTDDVRRRRAAAADVDLATLRERYEASRDLVSTLQRSLLPAGLPVLQGFRIAAHYLVASAEQAAGGDWFEAVPVGGRVAAVVGDVVGHGAQASAVMAQLRAVLVEFLLDGDDLPMALARLDRFATRVPGARGATVCLAMIDPADRSMRYACAGHPPPLVVSADGSTRFLPAPGGGPLGLAGPSPQVGTAELAPGDLLLCFSDGLVERPGVDLAVGLAELAEIASAALRMGTPSLMSADATDRVAELTVERMTRQGHQDDVTVLAVRLTGGPVDDFAAEIPAEPGQLSGLRGRLDKWLVAIGASEADIASIEIAVLEAVTNGIEHAYPGTSGSIRVDGVLDAQGRAAMTVTDDGTWRVASPDPGHRGRGLLMMRGCMDTVEIDRSASGTTLLLDRRLHRDPVVTTARDTRPAPARPAGPGPDRMSVTIIAGAEPRIAVVGPIDISTVEDLRRELWWACRGGALSLVVELAAVTHLASAGIQVLYDFVEELTADGRVLRFVAPLRCPARHALAMSDLDRIVDVTEV